MPRRARKRRSFRAHYKSTLKSFRSLLKTHRSFPIIFAVLFVVIGVYVATQSTALMHSWQLTTIPKGKYVVVSQPTIDSSLIESVLKRYHSPATGKGQALYDYGVQYNIDPAFALAFFMHESTFGTRGVASRTHSLGNIRATSGYKQYAGHRAYETWEEGFEDWYKLIANLYVGQWRLYTVDKIIPVYAPAADHNDEKAYIHAVESVVDAWRNGQVDV